MNQADIPAINEGGTEIREIVSKYNLDRASLKEKLHDGVMVESEQTRVNPSGTNVDRNASVQTFKAGKGHCQIYDCPVCFAFASVDSIPNRGAVDKEIDNLIALAYATAPFNRAKKLLGEIEQKK